MNLNRSADRMCNPVYIQQTPSATWHNMCATCASSAVVAQYPLSFVGLRIICICLALVSVCCVCLRCSSWTCTWRCVAASWGWTLASSTPQRAAQVGLLLLALLVSAAAARVGLLAYYHFLIL
jgi:hypothetical protein